MPYLTEKQNRNAGLWLTAIIMLFLAGAVVGGEAPGEKLDLIRRIITERGEYDLAESQLQSFIEENSGTPAAAEALVLLGYSQDKLRKNAEAAASYSRLLSDYPSAPAELRADAALGAADAEFRLEQYTDAIRDYTTVIELSASAEQKEAALLWRGEARQRLTRQENAAAADFQQAAGDFAQFVRDFPDSKLLPSALSGAGFAFFDAGDYERAAEYFRRFASEFAADRRAGEIRYYLGDSLYRLQRYDEARSVFAALQADSPAGEFAADARAGIAWIEYSQGRTALAAAGFEEAAELAGAESERGLSFLYDAGCAWREAGEAEKAARPFLEVAKASGHELNSLAWFRLATLWQEQAKVARERAERAATAEEKDKFTALQAKLGEDAAQYFRRALAAGNLGDEEIEALSLLGEVLLDAGGNGEAAETFAEIAARWPDSERAPWALYHGALAERALSLAGGGGTAANDHLSRAAASLEKSLAYPSAKTRLQASWALADYRGRLGETSAARELYRWLAADGPAWAAAWRGPRGEADPALENRAREYAADSLFRLGESYYLADDYPRASGFYQEVLSGHAGTPVAVMATLRLGEIAEAGKDSAAARARYEEALTLGMRLGGPKVAASIGFARLRLGALLLREGQKAAAAADRERLLQEAAGNLAAVAGDVPPGLDPVRPLYYLAEARYSLGQKREALAEYEKCLAAGDGGELADAVWFGIAWTKRDLGDGAGALAAAGTVVEKYRDSALRPDAMALLASVRLDAGDAQGALDDIRRLLADYPGHPLALRAEMERAAALDKLGRHDEAAKAFADFLAANPGHPDAAQALYQRSWALWNRIRPDVVKLRDAEAAGDTAGAARLRGDVKKAEDEILKSLGDLAENHPDFPSLDAAWLRVGEILYDRGEYQSALGAYRKAAAAAGDGELADKAQYRLSWSIQRLAETAEEESLSASDPAAAEAARKDMWDKRLAAIDAFESIIGKFPDSDLLGDAAFRAAELRRRSGQDNTDPARRSAWFESAGERYAQALARGGADAPYRAAAVCGSGLCLLHSGKDAEAREVFRRILLDNPDGAYVQEAYWGLGQANLNLGAYADAALAFEAALAADKGTETAAKSRYGLGLTAVQAGDRANARMEFLGVDLYYEQYPEWAALALVQAARTALEDGGRDKAIGDVEKVLAKYADTAAAAEARELQTEIMGQQ